MGVAMAASNAPASAAVRANGPAVSRLAAIGNDASGVDDTGGRLDADDPVGGRRRDDGAIGLGADGRRGEIRGHGGGGAARRPGRAVIEVVRIPGLPA